MKTICGEANHGKQEKPYRAENEDHKIKGNQVSSSHNSLKSRVQRETILSDCIAAKKRLYGLCLVKS